MFGCLSKKRDTSANRSNIAMAPQPQQRKGLGNPNQSKTARGPRTRGVMEEDPLTAACFASFAEAQGKQTYEQRLEQSTKNITNDPVLRQITRQEQDEAFDIRQGQFGPGENLAIPNMPLMTRESMQDSDIEQFRNDQNYNSQQLQQSYLKFLQYQSQSANRFSELQLKELNNVFKKNATKQKIKVTEMGKEVLKPVLAMNKEQFRSQMGLLGQQQQAYLADRIFEVFDNDKDGYIDIQAFTSIMDVLCNGSEDEKHMFSFALMDKNYNGEISFDEFYDYFIKVISHWSSLINSHVRVSRQYMYEIFSQISHKDPGSITFDEYRKALVRNPGLLDWFEILNSSNVIGPKEDDGFAVNQLHKLEKQREEEETKYVKIQKEKVENIVRLKNSNEAQTVMVKKLESEIGSMQGQTADQLKNIIDQISMLKEQVQEQMTKKEEDNKQWEESMLQRQEEMSQYDQALSQMQGRTVTESNLGDPMNREQQLFSRLIEEPDGNNMPFEASADAEKWKRDDVFSRTQGQGRQPAMTFGQKQNRLQALKQATGQFDQHHLNVDQREVKDFDSNATLQQWQQKSLLQRTNIGSNSPTGQSSNFHFSQFNYEFTNANNARKQNHNQEENFQFDDRHLKTYDNIYDERDLETPQDGGYHMTKYQRLPSAHTVPEQSEMNQINYSNQPVNAVPKSYEQIMGPDTSLNEILNYDFSGRFVKNAQQTSSKKDWQLDESGRLKSAKDSPTQSISPIFEVLIKLRKGREETKEKVGEKRIHMDQVPSKQRIGQHKVESPNRVNQKNVDDDLDDIIPDPESPVNSRSPQTQPTFHVTTQQHSQNLKVNQRHQRRQEVMRSQTQNKSSESQSAMSSNLYRLSQMQGGAFDGNQAYSISQQEQAMAFQRSPQISSGQQPFGQNVPYHPHAQTERKADIFNQRSDQIPGTFPPSPVRRLSNQPYGTNQVGNFVIDTSAENEDQLQKEFRLKQMADISAISGAASHNNWGTRQFEGHIANRSAFNDDRNMRMDNASHFSQMQLQNQGPRSVRTIIMPPKPSSPKAEMEMLSKLDEVNSQVSNWLQKLESQKIKDKSKAKTARKNGKLNINSRIDEDDNKVVAELEALAKKNPQQTSQMIDTRGKKRAVSSFESIRPSNSLVSNKLNANYSDSDEQSHGTGTFTNAHKALAKTKMKNKSKKDKTFVHFGNEEWNLVLHMLFGIRQSVHSVRYDDVYQLTDAEFKSKYRYGLEAVEDQKIWNLKKYEFYDFSPRMFNLIRKFYGINSNDYLKSIGPETLFGSLNMGRINSLKSQCSAGKSGSLFYYTTDGLYMLKTISHDEFEHFKAIMGNYYRHMLAYPHTMITRFYGLHKIKFTRTTRIERVYFVIMANVFNTKQSIDVRFDLKGSLYGRQSRKKADEVLAPTVALKDKDWLQDKRLINLRDEQRNLIEQQLKADTKFFQENNINDYSVLLGISKLRGGPAKANEIMKNSVNHDTVFLEGITSTIDQDEKRKATKAMRAQSVYPGQNINIKLADVNQPQNPRTQSVNPVNLERNDSDLLLHQRKRPEKAFFESHDGGIISADKKEIYFMGIIDILTNFGKKKRVENIVRSIIHDSQTISCIPPQAYGERFYTFMTEKVYLTQEQIRKEIKAKEQGTKSPVFD